MVSSSQGYVIQGVWGSKWCNMVQEIQSTDMSSVPTMCQVWVSSGNVVMNKVITPTPALSALSTHCPEVRSGVLSTWISSPLLPPVSFSHWRFPSNKTSSTFPATAGSPICSLLHSASKLLPKNPNQPGHSHLVRNIPKCSLYLAVGLWWGWGRDTSDFSVAPSLPFFLWPIKDLPIPQTSKYPSNYGTSTFPLF